MYQPEFKKYLKLNELAEQDGIVIFGCNEDTSIPTCELRQAFSIDSKIYNRSFINLSISNALDVYKDIVAPLFPEAILIHLGEADRDFFINNPFEFDSKYCELIASIRAQNKSCRIAIVSLKNHDNISEINEMNKHLKYIADSERCEYIDISNQKVWNPKASMNAAAFVYSIGFVRPLKTKRPLYDLAKIVFCYDI